MKKNRMKGDRSHYWTYVFEGLGVMLLGYMFAHMILEVFV